MAGCTSTVEDIPRTSATPTPVNPAQVAGVPLPEGAVADAVAQLDRRVEELMDSSGIPGMAVAVVHAGATVYAKGFGVREVGSSEKVTADTVFQLASLSKPIGATVVAHQVGKGIVDWGTPVAEKVPGFSLADPDTTENVTVGDLYAHRSGLPGHAGDILEGLGYDRQQILERLRLLPINPFRNSYAYTNFGLTAAAEAVANASGTDWATLSQQALYEPLGMSTTSSRYADYAARENRAVGHMKIDGTYVAQAERDPDPQSPAGGVSSSVNDLTAWLKMLLANGEADGRQLIPAESLLPAISPQNVSSAPTSPDARAGFYGYGFDIDISPAGRIILSHSGAFASGAATSFVAIPSADVAIVALTNAAPIGVPETLTSEFAELVQFGEVRQDWVGLYEKEFPPMPDPEDALTDQVPTAPIPSPLATYVGSYANEYFGAAQVTEREGALILTMGPEGLVFPLSYQAGDEFTFAPARKGGPTGMVSKASFIGDTLVLEFFNANGLGTFTRGAP
ncbi:serine hydrolase [Rhodococcus sp. WMMA185]|uniref:serine hydrolase n=1 Tax=Rhodococcus sp. WMMA185 TaxID=679318 RepID=UPI00087B3CF3|nr:serine hydrolase [Rhodococcus sp. WMMA185]AOW91920.1 serine hydrolase [Rhodococcus sp. WMMA185]